MNDGLLTVQQASEFLHISVSTLHKLSASKSVAHYRLGKRVFFKPEDLEEYLESRRVPATVS